MGLFSFFSKDKKQELDKGLEKTKDSFFSKISKAVIGKSTVDEEVLDNLEEILVTSDVGVETTLKIIDRIEKRVSRDKYLGVGELNKILRDEIIALLDETEHPNLIKDFRFSKTQYSLCDNGSWRKWCWKNHHNR
jgi:fused signal recognition particle receptor